MRLLSDFTFISPNGDGLGDTLACFISVKRNGMFSGPYIYDENNELVYSETEENESDKIGVYDLMVSDLADDEDFPEYFDCKALPAFAQFWITGSESVGNELQKQFDFSDVIPAGPDAGGSFTVEYDVTDFSSYEIGAIDRAFNIADSDIMPDEVPVPGDLNLDKQVDISDAVLLARLAVEDRTLRISDAQKRAGDCNHDGRTNADDLTAMLQYLAKLIPALDAPTKENATAA